MFWQAYANEPDNYGLTVTNIETLYNWTVSSDISGLQVILFPGIRCLFAPKTKSVYKFIHNFPFDVIGCYSCHR